MSRTTPTPVDPPPITTTSTSSERIGASQLGSATLRRNSTLGGVRLRHEVPAYVRSTSQPRRALCTSAHPLNACALLPCDRTGKTSTPQSKPATSQTNFTCEVGVLPVKSRGGGQESGDSSR